MFKVLYEKVSEFECKNRNVEMLWNNLKKRVLGIMRDVAGRVERERERNKKAMDCTVYYQSNGWRKQKNVNDEE